MASSKQLTFAICVLLLFSFVAAISWMTADFRYWTFEERRIGLAADAHIRVRQAEFVDADGRTRRLWPGGGRHQVYLVDFIYTRCPSICQALGSEYQRMQQALLASADSPGQVKLLSISFDARDTLVDIKEYSHRHRAIDGLWSVVTPVNDATRQRLLTDLEVVAIKDGVGGYVHNAAIHLMNGEGELIGIFSYENWEDALHVARAYSRNALETES